ncbi:DnaA regulatory inactivator Hda, partial [bacterium]
MKQLPLGVRLSDRARFDSFLVGPNAAAIAAVRSLVAPGASGMLVLSGPVGSGRSHLLQAAAASLNDSTYLPLAELASLGPDVLEGASRAACVAIDDLQSVAGRLPWEERLFFLWREVEAQGGRLLIASDRPTVE